VTASTPQAAENARRRAEVARAHQQTRVEELAVLPAEEEAGRVLELEKEGCRSCCSRDSMLLPSPTSSSDGQQQQEMAMAKTGTCFDGPSAMALTSICGEGEPFVAWSVSLNPCFHDDRGSNLGMSASKLEGEGWSNWEKNAFSGKSPNPFSTKGSGSPTDVEKSPEQEKERKGLGAHGGDQSSAVSMSGAKDCDVAGCPLVRSPPPTSTDDVRDDGRTL